MDKETRVRRLVDHVISTLPADIDSRIGVLGALVELLPKSSVQRPAVLSLLSPLEQHAVLQREFPFSTGPNPSRK